MRSAPFSWGVSSSLLFFLFSLLTSPSNSGTWIGQVCWYTDSSCSTLKYKDECFKGCFKDPTGLSFYYEYEFTSNSFGSFTLEQISYESSSCSPSSQIVNETIATYTQENTCTAYGTPASAYFKASPASFLRPGGILVLLSLCLPLVSFSLQ
uniref:Uncharacterized protein n=1 Tax=Chromera velia CCMP2878 TaxID=1169474 RepID=A0A0G4HX12_9ALVE|eukprot:Cvel_9182.t1-p1 / transcript=Cvel_9182.t1 / gene=Cvel_9182 / organism=Chromera_velia_CCMP2878 / gene_product=hypothetical protein / transcript_product=hypothetical protein / location=Cvel_scaffold523:33503-33955(-) / protein_length=151 / sequence_SO=supercontig / SO=protein_coding / is_pseudo=false